LTGLENISIDDSVLVRQCQKGSSIAIERLILRYQNRIYNTILKICANPDDAAELTQDTFVKVIENINTFKGQSSFYTWAFRIAVNLTLNRCKRDVRLGLQSLDIEDDQRALHTKTSLKGYLADEKSPDPAKVAQDKELCDFIIKAIMQLSNDQRAVVVLRDTEGMNYAQIAETLDIPLGTVRSRLARARANLREILETFLK